MAEDLAREIIAQSKSCSNLAFSFGDYNCVLLYTSKDAHEKMLYHVCQPPRGDETGPYEFKYADLESAIDLVRAFMGFQTTIPVYIVLHNNLENEKVASLGRIGTSKLSYFLRGKMKLLDAIDVEEIEMHPLPAEDLRG